MPNSYPSPGPGLKALGLLTSDVGLGEPVGRAETRGTFGSRLVCRGWWPELRPAEGGLHSGIPWPQLHTGGGRGSRRSKKFGNLAIPSAITGFPFPPHLLADPSGARSLGVSEVGPGIGAGPQGLRITGSWEMPTEPALPHPHCQPLFPPTHCFRSQTCCLSSSLPQTRISPWAAAA